MAVESGIHFGSIQIVDSVHSIANVNTAKDQARQKRGKEPHDPDAKWGAKHKRKVKTAGRPGRRTNRIFLRVQSARQHECGKWIDHQSGDQFRGSL